jgi:hypothetical protein
MRTFILLFIALFLAITQFITSSPLNPEKIELLAPYSENIALPNEVKEESEGNIVIHGLILPSTDQLFDHLYDAALDNIPG